MSDTQDSAYTTLVYKDVGELRIHFDLYLPQHSSTSLVPAVVYFHGGGFVVGNRRVDFPSWLQEEATAAGYAFLAPDYRLLSQGTSAHEILQDTRDFFSFLSTTLLPISSTGEIFKIDMEKISVVGAESGALCAFWAALYVTPKPKALLSLFGMDGVLLSSRHLSKLQGLPQLDPHEEEFHSLVFPFTSDPDTIPICESIPGPENPRTKLKLLYFQLGTYLDYLTGEHDPSLSGRLREALGQDNGIANLDMLDTIKKHIPSRHWILFPELICHSRFDTPSGRPIDGDVPPQLIPSIDQFPPTLFCQPSSQTDANYLPVLLESQNIASVDALLVPDTGKSWDATQPIGDLDDRLSKSDVDKMVQWVLR